MREFSFKPAQFRPEQVWTIREGHLMRRGGKKALPLAEVTAAGWQEVSYRGTRTAWMSLKLGTEKVRLECNDGGTGRTVFLELIQAIANEIEQKQPGFAFRAGDTTPVRWTYFLLAIAGSLMGMAALVAAVMDVAPAQRNQLVVSGGLACALLLPVAWSTRPSLAGRALSYAQFAERLGQLGAPVHKPEHTPDQG